METTAFLSNNGNFTSFAYRDHNIRFRTSSHLLRYTAIKEWDNGYLVTTAKYDNLPAEEEEYIDLIPIHQNLYFDPYTFLAPIKEVRIADA
ncbi:MAG: hypothetical protein IJ801_03845 [Lachnospiraceae bacterium]|nr:hypothetical protein [Lachnospiraceae bacterium]